MSLQELKPLGGAPPASRRLRVVQKPAQLLERPLGPGELRESAVLVTAAAAGDGDTNEVIARLFSWFEPWTEHPDYRVGYWRCEIASRPAPRSFAGCEPAHLQFHTDMTRYLRPPEFAAIRCIKPDAGRGGTNLVMHVDDAYERLRSMGLWDTLEVLRSPHRLEMEPRHYNVTGVRPGTPFETPLLVPHDPAAPSRIFDMGAATKGDHLQLTESEKELLKEFVDLCTAHTAATVRVNLGPGDVLAFSNWRFMHARTQCADTGRVTEIAMGNERLRARPAEPPRSKG